MSKHLNTLPGYDVDGADPIDDAEDTGVGFSAGDRVAISDGHEMYPGEEGTVQCVAAGKGFYAGSLVVDVLIDGTSDPSRFTIEEIGEVL